MHIRLLYLLFSFLALYYSSSAQLKYDLINLGKHQDEALGVFINWNNTKFASCSVDETIKLWSLPDGKEIQTLTGHLAEVNNISFSGNDKWLASGSSDQTIKIWDVNTGECLKTLYGHTDQVIGVYFSQDDSSTFVASTSFDKTVKLWDVRLGSEIKTLHGHTTPINNVAYSYDGKQIASCGDDKKILIWSTDLTTKEPLMTLEGHDDAVLTVVYSFDSKKLASSDNSGTICIWKMPEGKLQSKFKAHQDLIQDLSFAEDNIRLVSGSLDKKVKLWNSDTGENLLDYDVGAEVWSVDIVSDASLITLACSDGSVKMLRKAGTGPAKKNTKGGKK